MPDVDLLRVRRDGQRPASRKTGRAGGDLLVRGQRGGHGAEQPHAGGGRSAGRPEQGQPQLPVPQAAVLAGHQGVDGDGGQVGALAAQRGAVDGPAVVRVVTGPAAEHVPAGPDAVVADATDLDLDPGAVGRFGVPRRDQLGVGEAGIDHRGGPGPEVVAALAAAERVGVGPGADRRGEHDTLGAGSGAGAGAGEPAGRPLPERDVTYPRALPGRDRGGAAAGDTSGGGEPEPQPGAEHGPAGQPGGKVRNAIRSGVGHDGLLRVGSWGLAGLSGLTTYVFPIERDANHAVAVVVGRERVAHEQHWTGGRARPAPGWGCPRLAQDQAPGVRFGRHYSPRVILTVGLPPATAALRATARSLLITQGSSVRDHRPRRLGHLRNRAGRGS